MSALLKENPAGLILPASLQPKKIFNPRSDKLWTPKKDLIFRIGKYKDIHVNDFFKDAENDPFHVKLGVGNHYRLERVLADGRTEWLTPWFHNNVTNSGLDLLTTSTTRNRACQVGSGNAAVADTNTTLQTFMAGTATSVSQGDVMSGGSPYYHEYYTRYDFATGAVVGNVAEVGVGPLETTGTTLFSRELIRDGGGNPTTIAVTNLETLRIHYKIRVYIPSVDVNGTVNGTISGGAASRNFTRRALGVNSVTYWGQFYANSIQNGRTFASIPNGNLITTGLVAITTNPSGGVNSSSASQGSYTNGTYTRNNTVTFGTSVANQANKTLRWGSMAFSSIETGYFQCEFDTALTKTNLQSLTFTLTTSWSRYLL